MPTSQPVIRRSWEWNTLLHVMLMNRLSEKSNYTQALGLGQSEWLHPTDPWSNSNIQPTLNSAIFYYHFMPHGSGQRNIMTLQLLGTQGTDHDFNTLVDTRAQHHHHHLLCILERYVSVSMRYLTVSCGEALLFSNNLMMVKAPGPSTAHCDEVFLNGTGSA